jgi:hypothetical protein
MACKRSGVRIPVAPLSGISAGQTHRAVPEADFIFYSAYYMHHFLSCSPIGISAGQDNFSIYSVVYMDRARGHDRFGLFAQVSAYVRWLVTKLVTVGPSLVSADQPSRYSV